jgi:hypothetical protein
MTHSNPYGLLLHTDCIQALGKLTLRRRSEPLVFFFVDSGAYGECSVKLCGVFGVVDVASKAYGELRRDAQASFSFFDVSREGYGEVPVPHSINQAIIEILTVCSSRLMTSSEALGKLTLGMRSESFGVSDVASEADGKFPLKSCRFSVFWMWPVKHMANCTDTRKQLLVFWLNSRLA